MNEKTVKNNTKFANPYLRPNLNDYIVFRLFVSM